MPPKSFTPKSSAKAPATKQTKLDFSTGTLRLILPRQYNWFSFPAEVRNNIYKVLFKPSAKYKTRKQGIRLLEHHELSAQILFCCKAILYEAQGMLYDQTFRIDSHLPKFLASGGRRGIRNLLIRRIELDATYVNQTRMRELARLHNLEVLVLDISIRGGMLPPDNHNLDSYQNAGPALLATYMPQMMQAMVQARPAVDYYIKTWAYWAPRNAGGERFLRWKVAYDATRQAVVVREYEDWYEELI